MTIVTQRTTQNLIELSEKATDGPWHQREDSYPNRVWSNGMQVAMCGFAGFDAHNARFIAAARNDAPDIARALAEAMEWLREDTGRNHPAHCICLRCETVLAYFQEDDNAG